MKNFFTLTLCFLTLSLTAQEPLTYPYNPDANSDQFVAVSDVLETIATYGDQFLPSEIMVGDTTLSNWIQILNQTLANQQAVIDSLQASLASPDTQLDSTMIADMIAEAVGLGAGGGNKYLVRLEYDVNEALITANTVFVSATGFETSGASIISQTANSGNSGHDVTLNFSDTNPPTSIIGYGWNPATGNYTAAHYDRDTKQVQYEVGMGAFTHQATTDGASGADGQWGGASFSGAGSYNIKLIVDQSALTYGNAVAGAFGNPSKLPHAYLILSF